MSDIIGYLPGLGALRRSIEHAPAGSSKGGQFTSHGGGGAPHIGVSGHGDHHDVHGNILSREPHPQLSAHFGKPTSMHDLAEALSGGKHFKVSIERVEFPTGRAEVGTGLGHTLTHHDKAAHAASADAARASHKAYSTGSSADHAHAHQAHVHAEAMHNKAAEHATHPQMKDYHEGFASSARADQMGHTKSSMERFGLKPKNKKSADNALAAATRHDKMATALTTPALRSGNDHGERAAAGTFEVVGVVHDRGTTAKANYEQTAAERLTNGRVSRVFSKGSVEHAILELPKHMQGHGGAKEMLSNSNRFYDSHGVDKIELSAGLTVGRYAWARMGFTAKSALPSYRNTFATYLTDKGLHEEAKAAGKIKAMHQIADFKSKDGIRHGKEFLLASGTNRLTGSLANLILPVYAASVTRGQPDWERYRAALSAGS